MRSAREREAATRRAQFVELWEVRGVHSAPELAAILGVKPRHVERLIQEYRRGDMAKKIAKDRALDAQEAGDEPPEPPAPPLPGEMPPVLVPPPVPVVVRPLFGDVGTHALDRDTEAA